MRLGDLDALKEEISSWGMNDYEPADFIDAIDATPTVEPEKVLVANVTFDEDKLKEIVQTEVIEKIKSGELVLKTEERPQGEQIAWEQGYECGKNEKRPQGIEREIIGYEGLYSVDIFGTVRNLLSGKIIEHYVNEYGYHNVYLYKDGEKKGKRVNRLVAMAFIPNPLGKPQVNHIDGDKDNNNVWNLEWVTNKENSVHAGKTGLYGNGQVKIVETGEVFPNVSSLARYLNVDRSNIYKCLQGKRNKVRGYHFEKIGADMRDGAE